MICFWLQFEIGKELGFLDQESQRKYDELKSALYKRYKKQDDRFSYELVSMNDIGTEAIHTFLL